MRGSRTRIDGLFGHLGRIKQGQQHNPQKPEAEKRYIASVRTALTDPGSALYKEIPGSYLQSSVKDVLDYMLSGKQNSEQVATSSSVRKAVGNRYGYTITVGEKPIAADESVAGLFSEKEHKGVTYQALDMEIATNQEGGLIALLG